MKKKIVSIIATIIIFVVGAGYIAEAYFGGISKLMARSSQAPVMEETIVPAEEYDPLRVNLTEEELGKIYTDFSDEFLASSMPRSNAERTSAAAKVGWSGGDRMFDAVSFPFSVVAKDKIGYSEEELLVAYKELQEEIMRNPVVGHMVAQGFTKMNLEDGTNLADHNDWLKLFLDDYEQYGTEFFLTHHQDELDGTFVTVQYTNIAKKMLVLLDRCSLRGIQSLSTSKFWYLNSAAEANDVRTVFNTDEQNVDSFPWLVFSLDTKTRKSEVNFGFNIYDKRLGFFERSVVIVGGGQEYFSKDPTKDPVNQGNAQKGGGDNLPDQSDPGANTPDPSINDMQDAHDGEDQNQGHSDPSTVKPATPASGTHTNNIGKPDDGNPNTVEHISEQKMNYAPDSAPQTTVEDHGGTTTPASEPSNTEAVSEPG